MRLWGRVRTLQVQHPPDSSVAVNHLRTHAMPADNNFVQIWVESLVVKVLQDLVEDIEGRYALLVGGKDVGRPEGPVGTCEMHNEGYA